jgi:acyl carrier protein
MHSAGCLSDGTIPNQTTEKFETTINPKVRGGWNLHTLTLDCALEHFVMFSSVAATLGNLGQSNHSACNTFLDKLALYRRSMGLVASTINWGQWGEVGVAVGKDLVFTYPMTTRESLNALSNCLRTNAAQASAFELDFPVTIKFFPWTKSILELVLSNKGSVGAQWEGISSEVFWRDLNEAETDELKYSVIKKFLALIVTKMLRLDEDIEPNQNFQDMGMDSLMMIELKNQVQSMLGPDIALSAAEMADCKTLHLTTQKLMDLIYSSGSNQLSSRNQLIAEDSKLWDSVDVRFNFIQDF